MLHIIGSSIVRGHGWDFEFGWHRVAQHPLRKRQVHALKHTLYHRGLSLHLVGHGPTFVFQFTVHGAPVFLVRCNLRLLVVALKPLVRVSHISPLRSNFFLRRNITLVISTFMHHSFVIRRGLHWVVRSRFVRFHVFQISSAVRIINPFTLKRAIYTKGDFWGTMVMVLVLMVAIIMIANTILEPIVILQISAILPASEAVVILLPRNCFIAIMSATPVVHFMYGPTRLVMVFMALPLHPSVWVVLQELPDMGLVGKFFVLLHELSNAPSL
jgi:hypothetical protein